MTSVPQSTVPASNDPPTNQPETMRPSTADTVPSKRPDEDRALSPQKRGRRDSPSPPVSPTSSTHSSRPASAVPTEPFTPEEREQQHRRNENKRIRARQLEAHLLEAAEKLKHTNHEWMAKPMTVLMQPILSFVLLHENRFDAQIEGLRAEFKAGCEVLAGRIASLEDRFVQFDIRLTTLEDRFDPFDIRLTKLEDKLDACMANMDSNFELLLAVMNA